MSFPQSVAVIKKHEMIVASCVIMALCSFASLVGGTHLEFCNIVTDAESVNSERKLLLARAGK